MIKNILNLGDAALYCDFGKDVNEEINLYVISYFNHLKKLVDDKSIEGITNLSPSYNKLIVSFDLSITNFQKIKNKIENIRILNKEKKKSKKIEIPVCCAEKYAIDLFSLSKKIKTSPEEILTLFFTKDYSIYSTLLIILILLSYFVNTGCLLYPISFTCFENFAWSIPIDSVKKMNDWYELWSKSGANPNYRVSNPA